MGEDGISAVCSRGFRERFSSKVGVYQILSTFEVFPTVSDGLQQHDKDIPNLDHHTVQRFSSFGVDLWDTGAHEQKTTRTGATCEWRRSHEKPPFEENAKPNV